MEALYLLDVGVRHIELNRAGPRRLILHRARKAVGVIPCGYVRGR